MSRLAQWNTPLPYVFGGLVLIIGFMSVALIILACSHYKSSGEKEEKSRRTTDAVVAMETKIAVIMAGDRHPTHLAKPSALTRNSLPSS
ncbi:conserved hypothetical protein [Ricinus communis]|uniref:Protein GLUTAMINE DUMPER n=1 Tax=Ricinus communis TaxID=3988 RepID=B9RE83_RICCO|nr:conserved hypothetical protein [Ricinus communis]